MRNSAGLLILSVLALSACSMKFDQDPLKGFAPEVTTAIPPKPGGQKPTDPAQSEALRLIAPASVSLMEERTDTVQFQSISLDPFQNLQVVIENMADFPGATFDAKKFIFSWSPTKGVVSAGQVKSVDLKAHLEGQRIATGVFHKSESVSVRLDVSRKMYAPEVASVDVQGIGDPFREGTDSYVDVTVVDVDGGTASTEEPTLYIFPPAFSSTKSLAHLVAIDRVVLISAAQKKWKFSLRINLSSEEFTKSSSSGGFQVQVVNRFGQKSVASSFSSMVYTTLTDLSTSWQSGVEAVIGNASVIPFLIYDQKSEAKIDQPTFTGLPAGATVTCNNANPGVASCQLNWTPPKSAKAFAPGQVVTFNMTAVGRNTDSSDPKTVSKTFPLSLTLR